MSSYKPDFGARGLPPLPVINSPQTRLQVFTHRSVHGRPAHLFEDPQDDPSPDNETLEHLGDSVLNLIVTSMLRHAYPHLRVGPSTKIRALIVGNTTLASIAVRYRLHEHLRLHAAQAIVLRASVSIQADVFESYIGGLYVDQGFDAVKAWLHPLLQPYVLEAYAIVRKQHGLPAASMPATPPAEPTRSSASNLIDLHVADRGAAETAPPTSQDPWNPETSIYAFEPPSTPAAEQLGAGYLALFNQHLAQQKAFVEWVFTAYTGEGQDERGGAPANPFGPAPPGKTGKSKVPWTLETLLGEGEGSRTTPVWVAKAMMGKKCLGTGKGRTKKAAKNEAAKAGLDTLGVTVSEGASDLWA